MAAAACGRIVTVPKTSSNGGLVPAGDMLVRYRVLGTLDFVNVQYAIVFNTTGNGITPQAPNYQTYLNYSFILVFGGTQAGGAAYTVSEVLLAGSNFTAVALPPAPQFVTSFNANSSGQGNEFTFTFSRSLLTPIPNAGATPSPSPTSAPTSYPTLASGISSLWAINAFSVGPNGAPIDSIAYGGIQDQTFSAFVVNTLAPFDVPVNKAAGYTQVTNVNAQIIAVEIINSP
jgi:hypothetical protein